MAFTPNKFNLTVDDWSKAAMNWNTDTFKVALCANAPAATDHVYADLAGNSRGELTTSNGYTAGGATVSATGATNSTGTESLAGASASWTSVTGNMGPFRYPVLYDSTSHTLIEWIDLGANVTLDGTKGDQFVVSFGSSLMGTLV